MGERLKANSIPKSLLDSLNYDPETGLVTWRYCEHRLKNWNVRYAGKEAGSLDGKGYLRIKYERKSQFGVHRIAWVKTYGEDPIGFEIDHVNGIRTDNRICNLRKATRQENGMNTRSRGKWPKGVYLNKRGKFVAQIKLNGVTRYLGSFGTPEAAHLAYSNAAEKLFGGFKCLR